MKLRLWVKITLIILISVIAIILLNNQNKKAIKHCIEYGYNEEYCKAHVD